MKLKYDEPLSNFALNFNVHLYVTVGGLLGVSRTNELYHHQGAAAGKGLHSSTFHLNLSRFCH